ncbi:hypothetical protein HF325_001618 [Metschnikowia pulcherrima]|uniref:F-box domain-containing protein n=1 Tax=Metschnikowia pulcherrima TaxID=27326 RepID=A0A8H7LE19_9ASCO|nr:hypothetical protein HF325_001618 [Metschnikowia pulcherrima]
MAITLIDLPSEILELIFAYATRKDVKNLALTCHRYRQRLISYIMRQLHVTWTQILELQSLRSEVGADLLARFCCELIHITTPDAYNEYQQNTFGELLNAETFPNLKAVAITSASLSHWLKYNKCTHIRSLNLINAQVTQSRKTFCLSHLDNFTNLHVLTLHKFHFDWNAEEMPSTAISELNLHDCTWQYPFNLALFNLQDSLRTLAITYSHNNSFVLQERFIEFLKAPFPGHLASLRRLSIGFDNYTENKKLLTLTILATFIETFSNLHHLHLYGWYTTEAYVKVILANFTFNFPIDVDVDIERQNQHNALKHHVIRWKRRLYDMR